MKIKFLLLSSILLFSCSLNNISDDISSDFNTEKQSGSIYTELKEEISICKYYNLDMLSSYNYTRSYFEGLVQYFYNEEIPDFCIAGDILKMEYYGEIDEVIMESNNGSTYILDGELESIEYKQANIEKVSYSKKYSNEKNRYVFAVNDYEFDYILIDKEYHISLIDDTINYEELYASY